MNKMTNWFPSHIKPVHAGVYEVQTPNKKANKYCYYDQHGWRLCSNNINFAERDRHYVSAWHFAGSSMAFAGSKWRGFKEKQT
jgi:hypothetical protein